MVTALERAIAALESIEAMANSRIRPADVNARVEAATRVAQVNAAVAIAQALNELAESVATVRGERRLLVSVSGTLESYNLTP